MSKKLKTEAKPHSQATKGLRAERSLEQHTNVWAKAGPHPVATAMRGAFERAMHRAAMQMNPTKFTRQFVASVRFSLQRGHGLLRA